MKKLLQKIILATAVSGFVMAGLWAPVMAQGQQQESQATDASLAIEGARYWSSQCQRCHNLREPGEFTDDIWDVSINHMRIRANIPVDQIRAIKAFLKSSN